jgi:hypothetical protein
MRAVDQADQVVADKVALRDLVDSYAHHVDRRDAQAGASLFAAGGRLVSHLDGAGGAGPIVRQGRDEIAGALAFLDRYVATTHVVGGQTVTFGTDRDRATGETVCLAHHVYERDGERRMLVMAVRYADVYAREPGGWAFAERQLTLDWREDRVMEGPEQ